MFKLDTMVNQIMVMAIDLAFTIGTAFPAESNYLSVLLMRSTFQITDGQTTGTSFIIGKPNGIKPGFADFVLVTANHVLSGFNGDTATIILRKKESDSYLPFGAKFEIRKSGREKWKKHKSIDVAAMKISLPAETDIRLLGENMLATDSILVSMDIRPGDEVLVLGYPRSLASDPSGFPVLRSGRVSSYPITPVARHPKLLIDFNVFPGNSGGPVFIQQELRGYTNGTIGHAMTILGLVSEEINLVENVKTMDQTIQISHRLGLSNVVPAAYIKEMVDQL